MDNIKSANPENKTEIKYFLYKYTFNNNKTCCGICNKPIKRDDFVEELDLKPRRTKDDTLDYPFYVVHFGCLDKWLKEHRDPVIVAQI